MTDQHQNPQQEWEIGPDGQPRLKQAAAPQAAPQAAPAAPQSAMPPTPGYTPPTAPAASAGGAFESATIDLTNVGDENEPVPDGWYKLLVEDIVRVGPDGSPAKSKSGEPKVTWRFRIAEGPRQGKILFVHTNTSGAGVFSIRKILKAFHGDLPKAQINVVWANYIGQYLWANVGRQKNNDEYNEIKSYRSINDSPQGISTGALAPGAVPNGAQVPQGVPQAPIAQRI